MFCAFPRKDCFAVHRSPGLAVVRRRDSVNSRWHDTGTKTVACELILTKAVRSQSFGEKDPASD